MSIYFKKRTLPRHVLSYLLFISASFFLILGVDRSQFRWLDIVIALFSVFLIMISIFINRKSQPLIVTKKRILLPSMFETRGKTIFHEIRTINKSRIMSYDISSGILTLRMNIDEFHEIVLDKFKKRTRDRLLKKMRKDLAYVK